MFSYKIAIPTGGPGIAVWTTAYTSAYMMCKEFDYSKGRVIRVEHKPLLF